MNEPKEATITINGTTLTSAQATAVRAAITNFRMELDDPDITDKWGEIGKLYDERLAEVEKLLVQQPQPSLTLDITKVYTWGGKRCVITDVHNSHRNSSYDELTLQCIEDWKAEPRGRWSYYRMVVVRESFLEEAELAE
jgi:hypothetical protein